MSHEFSDTDIIKSIKIGRGTNSRIYALHFYGEGGKRILTTIGYENPFSKETISLEEGESFAGIHVANTALLEDLGFIILKL